MYDTLNDFFTSAYRDSADNLLEMISDDCFIVEVTIGDFTVFLVSTFPHSILQRFGDVVGFESIGRY